MGAVGKTIDTRSLSSGLSNLLPAFIPRGDLTCESWGQIVKSWQDQQKPGAAD